MNAEPRPRRSPEEKELEKKLAELEVLQEQLGQGELNLATLQVELRDFERRYFSIVGVKYAELDEIEALIAEQLAAKAPEDTKAQEVAQEARTQAEESAHTAGEADELIQKPPPSPELKKLYRDVAKLVHPDLAIDEADRRRREELMARANKAYEKGEIEQLREILDEAEHRPESVKGEDTGARLVRAIRHISLAQKRLVSIKEEMEAFNRSDLYALRERVLEASVEDRDLLDEMASHLEGEIESAKQRLASMT